MAFPEGFEVVILEPAWGLRGGRQVLEFIEELKGSIPKDDRKYNPETKTWLINDKHREAVQDLATFYFADKNQINMFS